MTPERWQQVERVYYAALAADVTARPALLDEACAGDDALRREVLALLENEGDAEHFLSDPALDVVARETTEHSRALVPGSQIGAYRILAPLGAGGMGDVYRARDTQLGRDVALKILPDIFLEDAGRRSRFEREARLLAALNHPHIGAIYGLEDLNGSHVLILELVDGESLAQRLARGPLPIAQATALARQIADALEAAHEKGIVHRDLKPANIMVTADDQVKVLDFGLARASDVNDPSNAANSGATQAGVLLGTAAYMAPEQAKGRVADKRSDVWAFGCVLYEMLCGRAPFEGATVSDTLASVLRDEPDWSALPSAVPSALFTLLRRCLEKHRKARIPDLAVARFMLDDAPAVDASSSRFRKQSSRDLLWHLTMIAQNAVSADSEQPRLPLRAHALWAVVTLVMAAGIGLALWNGAASRPRFARQPVRMHLDLPAGDRLAPGFYPSLALSPDGTLLVFRSEAQGTSQLFLRRLDRFEAQPIPWTEGAHTPFFSPDGKWIGFLSEGKVMKVPVVGGLPQKICDAPSLSPGSPGAAWGPDDTIVFAAGVEGLMRVQANGGTPDRLTVPNVQAGEITHHVPQFLPGGKELLFTVRTVEGKSRVAVLSLASRQWDSLPIDEMAGAARYVGTGHLVYAQNSKTGRLLAVPFNVSRRKITGIPQRLLDEVYTEAASDVIVAQFTVSDSGVLAYMTGRRPEFTLVKVTGDGVARPLTDDAHTYRYPRVSGDGRQIALSIAEDRTDIYVVDAERGTLRCITTVGSNTQPTWTSDGRRIVFASTRRGSLGFDIYSIPADEGADPEPLVVREGSQYPSSWSPTAPVLAFYELNNNTARDIWVWKAEQRVVEKVLGTRPNERSATFSKDGHWLAYVSDELGEKDEVYIQRYPGPGGRQRVSKDGGTEPVWSRDGHELFYRRGRQLFAVTIDTAPPQVVLGGLRVVFDGPYELSAAEVGRPNYDVFPDGSFVMVRSEDKPPDRHVHVVLDWTEELKRLVPVK